MEQSCYRCNAPVEEGTAFCPNCGAPQIRVSGMREEPLSPATPPLPPGTPAEMQPPAQPGLPGPPPRSGRLEWSQAGPAAALAGLLAVLASALPYTNICLWVLVGGALSVALYQRRRPQAQLTPGAGARLGAATGLAGFAIFAIAASLWILLAGQGAQVRDTMQQAIEKAAAKSGDPRAQEALELLLTPGGLALMVTLTAVGFLLAFVLFGALGGALGAALFRRRAAR